MAGSDDVLSTDAQSSSWQPLLTGELGEEARGAVEAIAGALDGDPAGLSHPSFGEGAAGRGLFYAYLDAAWPERGFSAKVEPFMVRAIDQLAEAPMQARLYGGFVGVAWVTEHLAARDGEPAESTDDLNDELDEALVRYLDASPWVGDYDLIGGLAGCAVYGLERLPRAIAARLLERVVTRLDEIAVVDDDGIAWVRTQALMIPEYRELHPNGYYDLGVAHGVPGVLAALAGIVASGIAIDRAGRLLAGVWRWMTAKRGSAAAESTYGYGLGSKPARSAWCYGDPGIAAAMYAAARAVGSAEWAAEALALARHAAVRPLERTECVEPGLCHGAAGLALIYNRLWQATGEPLFAETARAWYQRTLRMRRADRGCAGFQSFRTKTVGDYVAGWFDDPSFLTGAGGIGLALLAGISAVEPAWDRLLLSSLRMGR